MKHTMKLLSISSDAKTVKGEGQGYLTAILYLSPERRAGGWNLCPRATEGCKVGCLYDAGRASVLKAIPRSRLAKTRFLMLNKGAFVAQLKAEISAFIKKSERLGLTPCVRLNGTSDIAWEKFAPEILALPVQFYDYTKRLERGAALPANYRLTYSSPVGTQCCGSLPHQGPAVNLAWVPGCKWRRIGLAILGSSWRRHRPLRERSREIRQHWVRCGLRTKNQQLTNN